jgi:hypothetical protein
MAVDIAVHSGLSSGPGRVVVPYGQLEVDGFVVTGFGRESALVGFDDGVPVLAGVNSGAVLVEGNSGVLGDEMSLAEAVLTPRPVNSPKQRIDVRPERVMLPALARRVTPTGTSSDVTSRSHRGGAPRK